MRTATVPEAELAGTRFLQAMLLDVEQPVPELLAGLEFDEVFSLLSKFGYLQDGGSRSELDDAVDPGFELSIAHGLAMLSWDAMTLERELGLMAWPWRSRLSRRMLPRLKELHDELKEIGTRAITLAEIVGRVLKDPPAYPAG